MLPCDVPQGAPRVTTIKRLPSLVRFMDTMKDTFSSLDNQIAEIDANLRLIDERRSAFVSPTDPPNLQLVRDKRRLEPQVAELRGRRVQLQANSCPSRGLQYFDIQHLLSCLVN